MDGFVKMIHEMIEIAIMGVSLLKESVLTIVPKELALSIQYLWDAVLALSNWLGYALAAVYYIGEDFGIGETVCDIFGYGYYVIDGVNYLIQPT